MARRHGKGKGGPQGERPQGERPPGQRPQGSGGGSGQQQGGWVPTRDAIRRDVQQAVTALAFSERLADRLDGQRRLYQDFPRVLEALRNGSLERLAGALARLYEDGRGQSVDVQKFLRDLPLATAHLAARERPPATAKGARGLPDAAASDKSSRPATAEADKPADPAAAAADAAPASNATADAASSDDGAAGAAPVSDTPEEVASLADASADAASGNGGSAETAATEPSAPASTTEAPGAASESAEASSAGPTSAPDAGADATAADAASAATAASSSAPTAEANGAAAAPPPAAPSPRLELRSRLLTAAPQLAKAAVSFRRNVATVRRACAPRRGPGPWRSDREVHEEARRAVEFVQKMYDAYADAWADQPLEKGAGEAVSAEVDRWLAWTQLDRYAELAGSSGGKPREPAKGNAKEAAGKDASTAAAPHQIQATPMATPESASESAAVGEPQA